MQLGLLFLLFPTAFYAAESVADGVRPGNLPLSWRTGGPNCMESPPWQVHEYNSDLYILRESGCTNYEKPFLYILFGSERAFLIDTGAGQTDVAAMVDRLMQNWASRNQRPLPELVVAHSHSHGDHVAGDKQFQARARTLVVPLTVAGSASFFGISSWPEGTGKIDLGNRPITVLPIPGHDKLSLAYYDQQTGLLFSGDTVYPGRLYVEDFPAFSKSIERLVKFTEGKTVTHLLGCHIEQSRTPFVDYPIGSMYQPEEHSLELGRGALLELNEAVSRLPEPRRIALRDLTLMPVDDGVWKELDAIRKVTEAKQKPLMWGLGR